ncbi:MAG: 16S rRNA (guanine(527)-N(7))-methyltransferase RsmG [Methylococcales bacterium]|nr:16S rRNA (guanine(527)-N(7))-methyltransferase RsmG [Methylococcales bacterium]
MENCKKMLEAGLAELNLALNDKQIGQLLAFIALIEKWNKAYNLTAIRDKEAMVSLHLLDSLAVAPFITGQRIIDIGTGAGLPGIPLAIYYPDFAFTLLDSNAKKTRFVQQAILELKLGNVHVCHHRTENYRPETRFDTVITRAFAELSDIVEMTAHLLTPDGVLLAMKGHAPDVPVAAGTSTLIPVKVPGIDAARCLVKIGGLGQG